MFKKFPTDSGVLYFGRLPDDDMLNFLKSSGVTVVWNLAYELFDLAEKETQLFENVVFSGIADYNTPVNKEKFNEEVSTICEHLENNRKVFVHCFGGRGRTGMALAIIAKVLNNMNSVEALQLAKIYCDGPETGRQKEYVTNY
jgi:protein-tyrosine phosphatase